jgi:alpha-L-fucosidase
MIEIKFRPSSHSEDGTIIATFSNEKRAKEVVKRLKRYGARQLGCRVGVSCSDAEYGTIERVDEVFSEYDAEDVEQYDMYQELIIEVTLPIGVPLSAVPLVVDRETAEIIVKLTKWLGKPEEKLTRQSKKLIYRYEGEKYVYAKYGVNFEPFGVLYINGKRTLLTKAVKVRGLF